MQTKDDTHSVIQQPGCLCSSSPGVCPCDSEQPLEDLGKVHLWRKCMTKCRVELRSDGPVHLCRTVTKGNNPGARPLGTILGTPLTAAGSEPKTTSFCALIFSSLIWGLQCLLMGCFCGLNGIIHIKSLAWTKYPQIQVIIVEALPLTGSVIWGKSFNLCDLFLCL